MRQFVFIIGYRYSCLLYRVIACGEVAASGARLQSKSSIDWFLERQGWWLILANQGREGSSKEQTQLLTSLFCIEQESGV
jgi:hypothetical protein